MALHVVILRTMTSREVVRFLVDVESRNERERSSDEVAELEEMLRRSESPSTQGKE